MTHKLADGCCSAVTPCSWQKRDPTTICNTCRAASPSVAAWLEQQEKYHRERARIVEANRGDPVWHRAQAAAFEAAHAYVVARSDYTNAPQSNELEVIRTLTADDILHIVGVAISSKDATLARIAAALLLDR